MKLIYLANIGFSAGWAHEIQIMKMCEAFAEMNNRVELVVPRRSNKIKEDVFDYYGIEKNFIIKKLPCLDFIRFDKYFGHLAFWIESITFNFFVFFHLILAEADIIYTRDKFSLPFGLFKKNLVLEAHSFPRNYFLYSPFFKKLKGMVVITKKLKELFTEQGIMAEKILVAPDGVDLEEFDIEDNQKKYREELGLSREKKIVGYVGRLETMKKEKGIDVLIEAFKILKESFDEILLCCVGGPKERAKDYQNLAKSIGLAEKDIIFIDQVKQKLIPKYLKSFDVLVIPFPWVKHYAHYASPLKLFEYMASRRPIVATNLPSIREILNDNNAILVKPADPKTLAEGIKKALLDSKRAGELSDRAFEDVQEYTWEKRVKNILEFIS